MVTKKLVTFHLSPAEKRAFDNLAGGNRSEYLRRLIRNDAEQRGIDWPDELHDTRGRYNRMSANTRTNQITELDELLRGVILPSLPHSADCEGMSAEDIADVTLEWWYGQSPALPEWFGDADREYLRDQLIEEIEYAG
jgi:hypothetical protein